MHQRERSVVKQLIKYRLVFMHGLRNGLRKRRNETKKTKRCVFSKYECQIEVHMKKSIDKKF